MESKLNIWFLELTVSRKEEWVGQDKGRCGGPISRRVRSISHHARGAIRCGSAGARASHHYAAAYWASSTAFLMGTSARVDQLSPV